MPPRKTSGYRKAPTGESPDPAVNKAKVRAANPKNPDKINPRDLPVVAKKTGRSMRSK